MDSPSATFDARRRSAVWSSWRRNFTVTCVGNLLQNIDTFTAHRPINSSIQNGNGQSTDMARLSTATATIMSHLQGLSTVTHCIDRHIIISSDKRIWLELLRGSTKKWSRECIDFLCYQGVRRLQVIKKNVTASRENVFAAMAEAVHGLLFFNYWVKRHHLSNLSTIIDRNLVWSGTLPSDGKVARKTKLAQ